MCEGKTGVLASRSNDALHMEGKVVEMAGTKITRRNSDFMIDPFDALFAPFETGIAYPSRRGFAFPMFFGYGKDGADGAALLRCDVAEDENGYEVRADLPGVAKEDVAIEFDDGVLSIAYKHDENKEDSDKDGKWKIRERRMSSCKRSIAMPEAEPESIKASMSDGVLVVKAGKVAKAETKKSIGID